MGCREIVDDGRNAGLLKLSQSRNRRLELGRTEEDVVDPARNDRFDLGELAGMIHMAGNGELLNLKVDTKLLKAALHRPENPLPSVGNVERR